MPLTLVASHLQRNLEPVIARLFSPRRLGRIATRMPESINRMAVEQLLNRVFAEQIAEGDFDFLQGRLLQLEIIDAELVLGLGFEHHRMTCQYFSQMGREADATLSIDSFSATQLVQQQVDPDTLFFQRKLKISGDTELAHHVKNTIDTLDPEVLPRVILRLVSLYRERVLQPKE